MNDPLREASNVDQPLAYLDMQLTRYVAELARIGVKEQAVPSAVYAEIRSIPESAHNRIRTSMKVAPERFLDELASFQAFEEIVYADGPERVPPPIVRARVIVLLYTSFVMLRDSLLTAVRSEAPAGSVSRRVFEFLAKDDLRLFRNSIAHGNWDYAEGFDGLVYWAEPSRGVSHREYRVDETTFDFWHRLSRAASYAAVLALTDPSDAT